MKSGNGTQQIRCGNCGRFAHVKYEWRGPSYSEVIDCENCEGRAFEYDPFAAAIEEMTDEEVRELAA